MTTKAKFSGAGTKPLDNLWYDKFRKLGRLEGERSEIKNSKNANSNTSQREQKIFSEITGLMLSIVERVESEKGNKDLYIESLQRLRIDSEPRGEVIAELTHSLRKIGKTENAFDLQDPIRDRALNFKTYDDLVSVVLGMTSFGLSKKAVFRGNFDYYGSKDFRDYVEDYLPDSELKDRIERLVGTGITTFEDIVEGARLCVTKFSCTHGKDREIEIRRLHSEEFAEFLDEVNPGPKLKVRIKTEAVPAATNG